MRTADPRHNSSKPPKQKPERHEFSSTMVDKAWWDPERNQCIVQFLDGTRYRYDDVTRTQWEDFKRASSAGQYVNGELNSHPHGPR